MLIGWVEVLFLGIDTTGGDTSRGAGMAVNYQDFQVCYFHIDFQYLMCSHVSPSAQHATPIKLKAPQWNDSFRNIRPPVVKQAVCERDSTSKGQPRDAVSPGLSSYRF